MEPSITLFCPGSLAGDFDDAMAGVQAQARSLVRALFQRARPLGASQPASREDAPIALESPEERWLRAQFELPAEAGLGAFAATIQAKSASGPQWIIRLASFHVGLDHLVLLPAASLELSPTEADALLGAAQEWLKEEPIRLQAITPELWQMTELQPEITRFDQMTGASSRQATGRNIDAWLPKGPSSRTWRRLANELQMLWHSHPVNLARQERGLPVINGLWFEGRTAAPEARPFDVIVSRDPVLQGLGHATGARVILPTGQTDIIEALSDSTVRPETRWLIDPGCWQTHSVDTDSKVDADPQVFGNQQAFGEGWRAFANWLADFDGVARPGRGRALRWVLTGNRQWVELGLSPRSRLCFWRRADPRSWFEQSAA